MRKFLILVLALGAVMLLGVHAAVAQGTMKTEVGDGEGELDIVAWVGYVERGETDLLAAAVPTRLLHDAVR